MLRLVEYYNKQQVNEYKSVSVLKGIKMLFKKFFKRKDEEYEKFI